MALQEKQKNKLRHFLRVLMVFIAVLLLIFAVVIPMVNNAIALGVENRLKALPLPEGATQIASVSAAGDLTDANYGMQYFGAILIQSDLPVLDIIDFYNPYRHELMDCMVEKQSDATVTINGKTLNDGKVRFTIENVGANAYMIYSWGSVPDWARTLLNADSRAN